jgi:hypothetical protein
MRIRIGEKMAIKGNYDLRECIFCDKESPENCSKCPVLAKHETEKVEADPVVEIVDTTSTKLPVEELPTEKPTKATPPVYTTDMIRSRLKDSDQWLLRGLLAIYSKQTLDEQIQSQTRHDNMVGFNALDASFLSSLAEQYLKKGSLTTPQIKACRKAMLKYSGQLAKIANGEL